MRRFVVLVTVALLPLVASGVQAQESLSAADRAASRAILKELLEINTTQSSGSTRRAAEAVAARLRGAGFSDADIAIVGPEGERKNIVVRLRASGNGGAQPSGGAKPLLLMAHLDVVEANREDWSSDPFVMREDSGAFYARGASDNKAGAAMLVANMIRWKRDGFTPNRDVIMLLSTDEETDAAAGVQWVLEHRRDLVDAEFALNTDGGEVVLRNGRPTANVVGAAEKVYQTFLVEVRNRGGHSSAPRPDNAIYQLAQALIKLSKLTFPAQVNDVTRAMFERSGKAERGQIGADMRAIGERGAAAGGAIHRLSMSPVYNSLLRTTCVPTMLQGGHAENALPQLAQATVNCRMFPGSTPEAVRRVLQQAIADTQVVVRLAPPEAIPSPPSPLRPDLMSVLERLTAKYFPGATVVPSMEIGASDGLFFRNAGIPVYNVSAIANDFNDDRAHGRDERVLQKSFYDSIAFWDEMVRSLAGGGV